MSLSRKLSLYLLLTALLIFVSLSAIFMRFGSAREERLVALYASFSMENFSDKVDDDFSRVEECLAVDAPGALEILGHTDQIMPYLERVLKSDSLIMGGCIAVVPGALPRIAPGKLLMEYMSLDKDGRWQRKHLGDSTYDYTTMPWFADAVRTGKPQWSEPYYDKGGGNVRMITYSYPLRNAEGRIVAVMTADVSVSALTCEIDRLMPVEGGYAFIINRQSELITYPDSIVSLPEDIRGFAREIKTELAAALTQEDFSKGKGKTFTIGEGASEMMLVCRRIEATDWVVCCVIPYSVVSADLDLVTIRAVILILCGLVILLILIRLIVVYSMRPLRRLTEAVESISSGNLDIPLPRMKVSDEIGRLNNVFSQMQVSLREQIRRLVETTREKEHIESELHIARSIQLGLVPHSFSPFPQCERLDLFAMLRSAKEVGGDLYDFFIRDARLFFTIGDVSGKGVPASLFMAVTRTLFRMSAGMTESPKEIVGTINDTIIKDNDECMFVTMFVGVLDLKTGELRFCNAGHNPAVITDMTGARFMKEAENIPVGVIGGYEFTEESIHLEDNQTLLLYTDGITEAENSNRELFGNKRLLSLLSEHADDTPRRHIERLAEAVEAFAVGMEQSDDLTMLSFRLRKSENPIEQVTLTNQMTEIEKVTGIVERLGKSFNADSSLRDKLNLILEEALVNVISYAYPQGQSGEIELKIFGNTEKSEIIFRITDKGKPFDPTEVPEPDIDASLDQRPIGGLGIFLVRNLSDKIEYRREDGKNILTITLLLKNSEA